MGNKIETAAMTWWNIRAWNGDLLDRIEAESEQQAYAIFFANEERRALNSPNSGLVDGRLLLGTKH